MDFTSQIFIFLRDKFSFTFPNIRPITIKSEIISDVFFKKSSKIISKYSKDSSYGNDYPSYIN